MSLLHAFAITAFALAGPLEAQRSHGYAFFAPGGATSDGYTTMTLHFGFGGEARLARHLGAGAEVGGLGFRVAYADSLLGVFSPNGYIHINSDKEAKIDPFVTGGYSLFFRSGHENLANVGGGVNIWPRNHVGIKLEIRDHVTTRYDTIHFWGFRFGVTFR